MEKFYVTWDEVEKLVDLLAQQIEGSLHPVKYIFGLQRGGLIPAVMLSHKLGIPMTQNPNSPNILVVDDICDTGETFKKFFLEYPHSMFACLHFKPHTSSFKPEFSANKFFLDSWVIYPWERKDSKTIQDYKL